MLIITNADRYHTPNLPVLYSILYPPKADYYTLLDLHYKIPIQHRLLRLQNSTPPYR